MSDPRSAFKRARPGMPAVGFGEPHGGPLWFIVEVRQGPNGGPMQQVDCLAYCDPFEGKAITPELLERPFPRGPGPRAITGAWPLPILDKTCAGCTRALSTCVCARGPSPWRNIAGLMMLKPRILIPGA